MTFSTRLAQNSDFEFLFELKKEAEFELIKSVFGWDEKFQRGMHENECNQARPKVVEISGKAVGSYLLEDKGDHFYFCRFFLLPAFHGKGIGSQILNQCLVFTDKQQKPVKLCYLQGSRVGRLYRRFGFEVVAEDAQFVYMERIANNT